MKYMLMMGGTKAGWDTFNTWPQDELKAHIAFMIEPRQVEPRTCPNGITC